MSKPVVAEHPQLHHYTTAIGLKGIIESQQLWATSISYLNDAEEHTGFYDRRLRHLLDTPIRDQLGHVASRAIEQGGGLDEVAKQLTETMVALFRSSTLEFNDPFITSFCGVPKRYADDGLLSQWRGYGPDGGYAIEFDSAGLEQLLRQETSRFYYQFGIWGDVEYYNQDTSEKAAHEETIKWEKTLKDGVREYLFNPGEGPLAKLLEPLTALSCLHKHPGFSEEAEVRIVALPANDELLREAEASSEKRPSKPREFRTQNGLLVPYIKLFGDGQKLPIRKILVGPNPDRMKRRTAAQRLLARHGIEAEVLPSDIPYLGR